MTHLPTRRLQRGFSLIEMMTALVIFLLISAVAFSLLGVAQKRYQTESQVLNSFQEARLGLDQIVRDINDAGFPPVNQFTFGSATPPVSSYAKSPLAWPNYFSSPPCQIGITCGITPTATDIIIESFVPGQNCANNGVSWIRYQLVGTTLNRGVVCKSNTDPDVATAGVMVPYVQNVMNNASAAQIAQFQAYYPSMFPAGVVPIFTYSCDTLSGPADCVAASASDNSPQNVRSVGVTLIVMAPVPDSQTGAPRLVELNGRGRRVNPNQ